MPVGLALGAVSSGLDRRAFSWRAARSARRGGVIRSWSLGTGRPGSLCSVGRASPGSRAPGRRRGPACWRSASAATRRLRWACWRCCRPSSWSSAGTSPAAAGLLTGIASFVTLSGQLVAAWAARRPGRSARCSAVGVDPGTGRTCCSWSSATRPGPRRSRDGGHPAERRSPASSRAWRSRCCHGSPVPCGAGGGQRARPPRSGAAAPCWVRRSSPLAPLPGDGRVRPSPVPGHRCLFVLDLLLRAPEAALQVGRQD